MSVDIHDQYCGSFGKHSDCPRCYMPDTQPPTKKKLRLGKATSRDWVADALVEIEKLMKLWQDRQPKEG